jgi:shikimate dehydrogenase
VTRIVAVIGWPVAHSRSPAMHDAAFAALGIDAHMIAVEAPPADLAAEVARLRGLAMLGASVTVPHKVAIVGLCDELDPEARAIGAVNCLVLADYRLVGHNTDAGGFRDSLAAAGFAPSGARAVVLGAGGAARAVAHALEVAGAHVDVVSRRAAGASRPWSELPALFGRADLVVDCTPTGLEADLDVAFVDTLPLDNLPRRSMVATLVYHRRTQLLERATALGHPTFDGRGMLIHQAARAFALWTGREPPLEVMAAAFDGSDVKTA